MKILLDQNLSRRLKLGLPQVFGTVAHVSDFGLERATDIEVWNFAKEHDYCVASKDKDFLQYSALPGHPPKVLWLDVGNCSTTEIAHRLAMKREEIEGFMEDAVLVLLLH